MGGMAEPADEHRRRAVNTGQQDSSSAAQLAAMVAPPRDREEIDAMRTTERRRSEPAEDSEPADDHVEDPPGTCARDQAESRWAR